MSKRKIVVRLFGGLGNQMFQYAFGRRVAIENNAELMLDVISGFRDDFYKRKYCLNNFLIKENFADKGDLPKLRIIHSESNKLYGKMIRYINKHLTFYNNYEVYERSIKYDKSIIKQYEKAYFIGYWQDEKYFKPIEEIIRNEFVLRSEMNDESKKTAEEINSYESVGIHLRKQLNIYKKKYVDLPLDYYLKAIEHIGKYYENIKLYIFSDSPVWAKENFKSKFPLHFVTHNSDINNHEEMRLLSYCKHQIIANSTFSWWAAWLNKNEKK